ncbi:LysR family transcriptional regulator [Paraferrimonas sedimenticola]|uniref:LysR family transcriptional regulator n=1 Tax=Paraferrimonas sedimenticola TaxID=375674 RepID=A0AA37RWF3_9GAMM|nr:LysR family transcriptional regulator [Paraferrimonas sedimenticola]GLP96303.1 LysR family transcriptional regulator [Paraferrimonas sedimenticola]
MINLDHLVIFITAVEQGSFSGASRALKRSVSNVSTSISNLESDLNVTLFDRSKKYPTLTPGGERLFSHAQTLLRQAARLDHIAQDVNNSVEEQFNIGVGEEVPMSLIEERIAKTIRQFPNTKFRLVRDSRDQLQSRFESGELDVLIRVEAGLETDADFYTFEIFDMVPVCSPDSALADGEIVANELMIASRQLICESLFDNDMLRAEVTLATDVMLVSAMSDLIKMVEQDIGWAYISLIEAEDRAAAGTLKIITPEYSLINRGAALDFCIMPANQLGPVAQFIKSQFTEKCYS